LTDIDLAPDHLAAIAALSSLRDAYPWLAVVLEAEAYGQPRRPSTPQQPPSLRSLRAHDELLRLEKSERIYADRAGIKQTGASAAPIRLALIDAEQLATTTVIDQAWIVATALRHLDQWLRPSQNLISPTWNTATTYLGFSLHDLARPELGTAGTAIATAAAAELAKADRAVRSACSLGDVRIPLPGGHPCPRCQRRSLRIDITSAEQANWTIACRVDCLCLGEQCECQRHGRRFGQVHVWPAEQLAIRLGFTSLRTLRRLAEAQARTAAAA
jgi:hypothetical protein